MSELSDRKTEDFVRKRIRRLVDGRKVALSAVALKSGVEQGTVKALYEQEGRSKQKVMKANLAKIEKGLDEIEASLGMVQRCTRCGKERPYGAFHFKSQSANGIDTVCRACAKDKRKKEPKVNNNTETAVTAEIVRKVKEEDKREVESKFMAPYFKLTPKQLDEIRKGVWDKLLLTPKEPKRADTVLSAVEQLRSEVAGLRREVEAVLVELGCEVRA